jgi:hypothetical protein
MTISTHFQPSTNWSEHFAPFFQSLVHSQCPQLIDGKPEERVAPLSCFTWLKSYFSTETPEKISIAECSDGANELSFHPSGYGKNRRGTTLTLPSGVTGFYPIGGYPLVTRLALPEGLLGFDTYAVTKDNKHAFPRLQILEVPESLHYFDFGPLPKLKQLILATNRVFRYFIDPVACQQIDKLLKKRVKVTRQDGSNMKCSRDEMTRHSDHSEFTDHIESKVRVLGIGTV